jgi:hypothetical protein
VSDMEPNPNDFASLQKNLFSKVRKGIAIARERFALLNRFGILQTFLPREYDQFWVKHPQSTSKGLLHHLQKSGLLVKPIETLEFVSTNLKEKLPRFISLLLLLKLWIYLDPFLSNIKLSGECAFFSQVLQMRPYFWRWWELLPSSLL